VLERLPQPTAPRLANDSDGINAPFRESGDGASPAWVEQVKRPVFLAVFTLLVGALVLALLPNVRKDDVAVAAKPPPPTAAETAAAAAEPAAAAPALIAQPDVVPVPAPAATASVPQAAVVPTAAVISPPAAAIQDAAAATPTPTPAAPRPTESASAPVAHELFVVRTQGESWVEVVDAQGAVALRKLLGAGESAGASGRLPLHVTIGRADATEVQVRGKPFDLRPVSRDNVARFEVK
jgi:cytoskeleton protein RodZ